MANIVIHHQHGTGHVNYAGARAEIGSTFPVTDEKTLQLKSSCHKKYEVTITNQEPSSTITLTGPQIYTITFGQSATLSTCKCVSYLISYIIVG